MCNRACYPAALYRARLAVFFVLASRKQFGHHAPRFTTELGVDDQTWPRWHS